MESSINMFEKFFKPKVESETEDVEKPPKTKLGPYRISEAEDPDRLKALREKFRETGKFEFVSEFSPEGVARVSGKPTKKKGGKMWLVNEEGEMISEKFGSIFPFRDGIAAVFENTKWSFINPAGERITEEWFDTVLGFSEGLAKVKKDGEWFYIDKEGKRVDKNN